MSGGTSGFPRSSSGRCRAIVQRAWDELVERMQAEYERQLEEAAEIRELLPLRTGLRLIPDRLVVIRTDYGEINVQMRWDAAPHTAEHFSKLAQNGYYRDVIFHRIVPYTGNGDPFVIQAGDPSGTEMAGLAPGFLWAAHCPRFRGDLNGQTTTPTVPGAILPVFVERGHAIGWLLHLVWETLSGSAIRSIASVELADPETGSPVRRPNSALFQHPNGSAGSGPSTRWLHLPIDSLVNWTTVPPLIQPRVYVLPQNRQCRHLRSRTLERCCPQTL